MNITVTGQLVAVAASQYSAFIDRSTGETVAAGTTYSAHVVTAPMTKPVEIRITEDQSRQLDGLIGKRVSATVELPRNVKYRASAVEAA